MKCELLGHGLKDVKSTSHLWVPSHEQCERDALADCNGGGNA